MASTDDDNSSDTSSLYNSDEFEQELPGESSTLPLQHQDAPLWEEDSSTSAALVTTTAAAQTPGNQENPSVPSEPSDTSQQQQIIDAEAGPQPSAGPEQQQQDASPPASLQQQQAVLTGENTQQQQQPEHHQQQQQQQQQQPFRTASPIQSPSSPRPASLWARTSLTSSIAAAAAAASPSAGKPSYAELSLRCQSLENALVQQQQHSVALQQALSAAHAAHAAEEASIRQYYEAQLFDRQQELQLLMERLAAQQAAVAVTDPEGAVAEASSRAVSPEQQQQQQQQEMGQSSPSPRPASQRQQGGGYLAVSASASSAVLADVALLRRELAQAEQLLGGYEEENRAAARRIKDLESQLSFARSALADEAGRAQRAAAAAAEAHRAGGAAAAERLSRQLQLEGQLESLSAAAAEREAELMQQIEMLRRDKAAAEARAAAAAEGVDMGQWQAEDTAITELRNQLSSQSAAHQHQLSELQARLAWYAENQSLLGQSDQLVAQQAEVIRQLETRLRQLEGRAGSADKKQAAAGRISELEQQVHHLKQLLVSRHPASLPAAAVAAAAAAAHPAESAALTAAESTIQQLQDQLDLQQQQHEHGLRALQQQYEALKVRLEQRQAKEESSGQKGRVRELTQQLDEQRNMYTRRIRALEAKLTAAQGAAAAASRRSSAAGSSAGATASSSRRPAAGKVGLRTASKAHKPSAASAGAGAATPAGAVSRSTAAISAVDGSSDVSSADGDQQYTLTVDEELNGTFSAEGSEQQDLTAAAATADAGVATRDASVLSGLLRVKERQMAGLMAQLEERTSQFLQLQQRLRVAERQIKQLTTGSSKGNSSNSSARAGHLQSPRDDVNKSDSPASPPAAAAARHIRSHVASAAAAVDGTSWPALCAELEGEVDQLKEQLAAAQQTAHDQKQQIQQLAAQLAAYPSRQLGQQHAAAAAVGCVDGMLLPPVPVLLSVAEEAASREAVRWRNRVRTLEEALHDSQAEVSALQSEVAHCRAKGRWTPSAAAFEALERKISSLEAAHRQSVDQHMQAVTAAEMQAVVGRYEQLLAAKDVELQGFRVQLDALIAAAKQLQGIHSQ